jgi:iron(III) transport system permease protein
VTILICWFAMRGLGPQLTDAARIDGAGPWARFWQVGVAACYPALAVAWLVALALACGELSATILVVPPGVATVTLRIFGLLHAGVTNQAAALSLTMLGAVFAVSAVMHYLLSRLRAESSYRVPSPRVGGAEPPCDNQTWSVCGS